LNALIIFALYSVHLRGGKGKENVFIHSVLGCKEEKEINK